MFSIAGHVFGIGLYDIVSAWNANVDTSLNLYTGAIGTSIFGGAIPLESDFGHIADETAYDGASLIMVPITPRGIIRREYTDPEFGILRDLGYVSIPEPSTIFLSILGILTVFFYKRFK